MILRRALLLVAAVAALMTATGVITIAIAFAVYAAFEPALGRAFAAAATAAIFAAAIGLFALVLVLMAESGRRARARAASRPDAGLTERVMELIREKPFAAAGIAAAAGLMAMRNPRMIGAVLGAFLEGWRGGATMRKKP